MGEVASHLNGGESNSETSDPPDFKGHTATTVHTTLFDSSVSPTRI